MIYTTLIDVASLVALRGAALILDCRYDLNEPAAGRAAYLRTRIPGARYADLNLDLSSPVAPSTGRHPLPAPDTLARFFEAAGIGEETQVIAYDDANGAFAARAWWLLRWLGHTKAAVLDGGFKAWLGGGEPLESGDPGNAPGCPATHFTVRLRPETLMTTAEVLRTLGDPRHLLVDARAAERYAGIVEPFDPVAGHVPGAVNHPFTSNLGEAGRFLPADELRRRWQACIEGTNPADVILMCGSGVTACHNVLALELAGLPGGKLYAGSWSEWIRDPERPVARGTAPPSPAPAPG